MVLTIKKSTSLNIETRIKREVISLIIKIKKGLRTRVTKVNIGRKIAISTVQVPLSTKINTAAVAAVKTKKGKRIKKEARTETRIKKVVLHLVRTKNIRAQVVLAETKKGAKIKIIINQVQVLKTSMYFLISLFILIKLKIIIFYTYCTC